MKKNIIVVSVITAVVLLLGLSAILFWYVMYPVKHKNVIQKYCNVFNLEPSLVCAVINTESGFNKNAVSAVGAKGLMQLMPSTATEIATKLNVANYTEEMLFTPDTNIRFGCYYLNYLLNMYNGNVTCAVAAYNAGFNNVNSWLENSQYSTNNQLTNIPVAETKNYVKKVYSAIKIYNFRY
ncbi:MAG: lytic transglycosylase domain-containing protein [Clostridia bacterium]|nr:lytic transglycosylase domain-containing protein [Clostridia bacterium]